MTYREVAELTASSPETVRRYMGGQSPSAEFLIRLCQRKGINGQWLLTGQGAMRASEIRAATLREAGPGELMSAVAVALETLRERVDRLERFVHTQEVRLRVAAQEARGAHGADGGGRTGYTETRDERQSATRDTDTAGGDGGGGAGSSDGARARRIGDAFAQRPRAHVD